MSSKSQPFLKWPGGKRWLTSSTDLKIPGCYNKYYEPFLGGGAMFLYLSPREAWLSDSNSELINAYMILRDQPCKLHKHLIDMEMKHCREYYYEIRSQEPSSSFGRAVRFIYLNRTCWNGLYRVNLKGKFNVPIGSKTQIVYPLESLISLSKAFEKVNLVSSDFEPIIDMAEEGDFVYADPPYTANHNNNGFIKYNEKLFSWYDQVRLFEALHRAKDRGVKILVSNADHPSIKELYSQLGTYTRINRQSVLAAKSEFRKNTSEALYCTWS